MILYPSGHNGQDFLYPSFSSLICSTEILVEVKNNNLFQNPKIRPLWGAMERVAEAKKTKGQCMFIIMVIILAIVLGRESEIMKISSI